MGADIKNECLINGVQYKCRTCFDPGRTVYSLTDEASNAKTWGELLKDIAQIQTNDDELLPKTVCCKCQEKLKRSYDFMLQIHNVNKKYSQLLANGKDPLQSEHLNENNTFNDCLAESAINLPLEEYMPEIKLEQEMVSSYNIDLDQNKLDEDNETKVENEDTDDPFTETFDGEFKSASENESAIPITGKKSTKRNHRKTVAQSEECKERIRNPKKRIRKPKQPKKVVEKSSTNEKNDIDEVDDGKDPIVCDKCSKTFLTIHTYQRHQQAEHSSGTNQTKNKCPICSREFVNSWYVVDHIKVVHDKIKPFKCSHCPKSFASAHSKRIHELTHTDTFPYVCEFCDRRFRLASKLKIHSEIHTTKPELLCPICKRSQRSQEELEVHVKNHDDNRLQCPSCGHLFRRNSQLKDHYNAVHLKLRPYKCEFCELGFGDRKTRRVHQRTHHKQDLSLS